DVCSSDLATADESAGLQAGWRHAPWGGSGQGGRSSRSNGRAAGILPVVNVLLYAFRNDSADHDRYRAWLSDVVNSPQPYGISPQVLAAVIRVTTHPRIFARPTKLEDAFAFTRVLLEQPNAAQIVPREHHWGIFEALCCKSA